MTDWADRAKERSWANTILKTTRKNTRNISDPEVKQLWSRFEEEENNVKKYEYCIQLISKDPKDYFAYLRAGDTLRELKQNDEAHEKYLKSLELSKRKCIEVLNNYGNFQRTLKNHDKGINLYDEGLQIDPRDTDLLYNKGNVLSDLEKNEEAIVCYDKALEIDPNDSSSLNNKSWSLCKLKRYQEALLVSEIAIAINTTAPEHCHTKGFILLKLKQYQDAIKWFDKALAVDPNHKDSIKDRQLAVDAAKLDK